MIAVEAKELFDTALAVLAAAAAAPAAQKDKGLFELRKHSTQASVTKTPIELSYVSIRPLITKPLNGAVQEADCVSSDIRRSVRLCLRGSVRPSVCLSIRLPACLPACLCVCQPIGFARFGSSFLES